jgi:assimilatory nitrate reductase catalytic subunit
MGGREVGAMATLLPGHRDPDNAADRAELAAHWGIDSLPDTPGRTAVEMFEAAADGALKLLWIACTNPAQSLPDQALVRRALQRAEFVIVQEAYASAATCDYADLLLPAAAWGEKDGTMTSSERRISRVRAVLPPAGQARPDWLIARDVARRLEGRLGRRRRDGGTLFPFETPEQVWNEHRALTRGRDLDIAGLSWARLEEGPQPWPFPDGATSGRARLYEDRRFATADGRARFAAPAHRPVAEPRDARHPFSLTTGRLRDQWHGMTRSGTLARLFAHEREPAIELHPQDLARAGFTAGELVRVRSRHGECVLPLRASDALRSAQAFVAMHWSDAFVGGQARDGSALSGVNALLGRARCALSKQPELKHVPVRIERIDLPWRLVAAGWLPAGRVLQIREDLRRQFGRFGYASCVPIGREPDGPVGLLLRAAAKAPPPDDLLAPVVAALGLGAASTLRYADPHRGRLRALRVDPGSSEAPLEAFLVAGDLDGETALLERLEGGAPVAADARRLLAGDLAARSPRPAQVCNCFDIDEPRIVAALADCPGDEPARLQALQRRLRCGTQCGSCLPALRMLLRRHPADAQPVAAA